MSGQPNMIEFIIYLIQGIFFLIILSYYYLLFKKQPNIASSNKYKKISIIIPARNESNFIAECIDSVKAADFDGKKEIIVVDDASTDNTLSIAKKAKVITLSNKSHMGKSHSVNMGISKAGGEIIAIVDADSTIQKDSLSEAVKYLNGDTSGVTCVIKVKNRKTFLGMWLHIEQLYNSLLRSLFSKINANIVTPGPLSVYIKKDIIGIGGFSTSGFSEDVDICLRLIRSGKKVAVSEKSISETNMPVSAKGFFRQRNRFAKGWIQIFKKHLKPGNAIIDIYSLPLALFSYLQAVIMSISVISQIASGYALYYLSKGVVFNPDVFIYFLHWFSIAGTINWVLSVFAGKTIFDFMTAINLMATLMSYPLYFISILRYDKKITIFHIIPIIFMFPYWFIIMIIYLINLPELFFRQKPNKWEKIN